MTEARPACWAWDPAVLVRTPEMERLDSLGLLDDVGRMDFWQDGRCAVCGRRERLVEDHDHATGLTRGWLCRSCNTLEGRSADPFGLFANYRERNPASMLGFRQRYRDPMTGLLAEPQPPWDPADIWEATRGLLDDPDEGADMTTGQDMDKERTR